MYEMKKSCGDCKTTKTPLWRTGPHGPRSLCNACGIRYRKRKMAIDQKPITEIKRRNFTSNDYIGDYHEMNGSFKMISSYKSFSSFSSSSSSSSSSQLKKQRSSNNSEFSVSSQRSWGEVEQAAVLLMSLSCGSVFA